MLLTEKKYKIKIVNLENVGALHPYFILPPPMVWGIVYSFPYIV
jgi:hypothetical protein